MSGLLAQANGTHLVAVALGAGLGAVCRAAVDRTVSRRFGATVLPWATLAVNVLGSLVLGVVLGWSAEIAADGPAHVAANLELFLGVGFAGGLSTFSTVAWESWSLIREGRGRGMLAYSAITICLALGAFAVAISLGASLGR